MTAARKRLQPVPLLELARPLLEVSDPEQQVVELQRPA
jgi:hypothetical protein